MTHDERFAEFLEDRQRGRISRRTALRRATAIGLGLPAATALLAAGQRSTAAQEKPTIRLATWAGVEEANELQAVIDRINRTATAFQIVSEPQPSDYYTKLQTTLAGGTAADLFWLSQEHIPSYATRGALLEIGDRLAADAANPAAKLDDYFPAARATAQYDGRTYGLPWISQPMVLYYNPALFEAKNVPPPDDTWDWTVFKEAAASLTDPDQEVYGTSFSEEWPPLPMFIWQAGGEVISEDLASCPIDSEQAIQAADYFADIIFNETYAPSSATITEQGFGQMAKAGKVAMFFGGAADDLDYAHLKDPKNAVMKVALVPKGPQNRANLAYTATTSINPETENQDAAFQALVALTDGIHHWKVGAPRQSLANVETIVASVPEKAESAETIVRATADFRAFRNIPRQIEWNTAFVEYYLTPLFNGEGTAEELAPDARAELEALLPG